MNIKEFIEEFKNITYYKELFKDDNILFAYISGCNLINITDEYSDIDIVIVTSGNVNKELDKHINYGDIHVHWYYKDVKNFFLELDNLPKSYIQGNVLFKYYNDDFLLYKNNKYEKEISYLISKKDIISNLSIYKHFYRNINLINTIINERGIKKDLYTKHIYHITYSYYILNNLPLDKDFLTKVKRMRYEDIDYECKNKVIQTIINLSNHIKKYIVDFDSKFNDLYEGLISLR